MPQTFNLYLLAAYESIRAASMYFIPEYPLAGLAVAIIGILLFVIYLFKQGVGYAIKISFITVFALVFVLFSIHTLMRLIGMSGHA